MMCARMLRAEDTAGGGDHAAASRGGFYARLDRGCARLLGMAMRHRWVIVLVSVVVLASTVPIYRQVKQEYIRGDPLAAFRDNYSQRDVMMELRRRFRAFRDVRTQVRNIPGFNIGGGSFEIDLALSDPELEKLAEYGEILKEEARGLRGLVDVDTTLRLDRPELRVVIDRERAADLRVEPTRSPPRSG